MRNNRKFFSLQFLLQTKDKNGKTPRLFLAMSRVRGPGKTYSTVEWLFRVLRKGGDIGEHHLKGKFVLIVRQVNELGETAEGMLKSYVNDHYPGVTVEEVVRSTHSDIYLVTTRIETVSNPKTGTEEEVTEYDKEHIGYVVPLRRANKIKKISSKFVDAVHAVFDEFLTEDDDYLTGEVDKFLTIHTSLARGHGESIRYYPVYMLANCIDIGNPYFVDMELNRYIQPGTLRYRGDGFVYQRFESESLASRHDEIGLGTIFKRSKANNFKDNSWLNEKSTLVAKPQKGWGRYIYCATLAADDETYGLIYYDKIGLYFITYSTDPSCPKTYSITREGMPNVQSIKNSLCLQNLRKNFLAGLVRIQSAQMHNLLMDLVSGGTKRN